MAEQDPFKYFKSEIKRLNYYNFQFLVETDFNDEQLYHKQMRRFHNRALHTWGIVEGLQVERVPNESKVTVAPGVAIDRLGQEIVLPERSAALGLDEFGADAQVYVTIKYRDVTDQADKDTSDTQTEGDRYKRWTERPQVSAKVAAPSADAPEVVLAVVKLDRNKAVADVSPSKRRYAGSRIGSSADGKEFAVYADDAGAWHFFDGGKGADRLTVDDKGNVGIGTPPSAARLSVLTTPGPYDGTLMDFMAEGGRYRLSLRSKAPARDAVSYHFDLVNNLGRFDNFLVFDRGNVGVGSVEPKSRLVVGGMIHSESEGFKFPDGTTQATAASSEKIPAKNVSAGTFGENTGGGNYTFPASVYWGSSASRTETKDNAGTTASRSGFFETENPVNYYSGATGWQHLIEARHSNNANNFALQIAGGFYDQKVYVRKTSNNGAANWSRFVLMNNDGKAGIGTENPLGPLSIGDSSVDNSDGYIVIGKKKGSGSRHFRLGLDDNFNFAIGDFGENNRAATWASSLVVSTDGNVGVGLMTAKPLTLLHIRKDAVGKLGPVLTLANFGGNTGSAAAIDFHLCNTEGNNGAARILGEDDGHYSAHLTFSTKKPELNTNPFVERMRITSKGNVGIGTPGSDSIRLSVDTGGGTAYSLKCEHKGSNFIVRPSSDGGNVSVIENTGGGGLNINPDGAKVSITTLEVTGDFTLGATKRITSPGRLHITGDEKLYLLNKDGVTIGKEWGGTGNLVVQGNVQVDGAISCGGKIRFRTHHGKYVSARDSTESWNVRQADVKGDYEQFTIEMACTRERKENISDLTADEALTTLQHLNPVKYDYKGERTFRQNLGFIAEEMPANLASVDRKSISPFEVVPVLTRVAKEQQKIIDELRRSIRVLQDELRRQS
ncbi:MAG TPA: tail fiber domain-containing protein [Pyrinomonadaceae bacterium]